MSSMSSFEEEKLNYHQWNYLMRESSNITRQGALKTLNRLARAQLLEKKKFCHQRIDQLANAD
jgi:hypothetical protein